MAIQAYRADLHIHTLLSPCAEVEMIPSLIVAAAIRSGLDMIAITDHNSCENTGAVIEAAGDTGLRVFPGMELQSVEGVHLLCLFDSTDQALAMQETVYESLPSIRGYERFARRQMVVNARGEFIRYCERPIGLPTSMDIGAAVERADSLGGMVVPSHIDRLETGICGVMGMMPDETRFDAVEVSPNLTAHQARSRYPSIGRLPVFASSDAHWLGAIGTCSTRLYLERRSIGEIRQACRLEGGRGVGDA